MKKIKTIENEVWEVAMVNDGSFQYMTVIRKRDNKEIFCYSDGEILLDKEIKVRPE